MRRTRVLARAGLTTWLLGGLLVVGGASAAVAHGILESASPEPESRVQSVPRVVRTTLTEDPLPEGRYLVRDGCGRIVNASFEVDGDTISARVADAQPGKWKVRFDFISSADGHRYNETYTFSVAGSKDCSPPAEEDAEEDMDEGMEEEAGEDSAGGSGSTSPPDESSHGGTTGSVPASGTTQDVLFGPLTIATVAVIGLALFGRWSAATSK